MPNAPASSRASRTAATSRLMKRGHPERARNSPRRICNSLIAAPKFTRSCFASAGKAFIRIKRQMWAASPRTLAAEREGRPLPRVHVRPDVADRE